MKQCESGHFFDDNRFSVCPYCKIHKNAGLTPTSSVGGIGETVAIPHPASLPDDDSDKTVVVFHTKVDVDPPVGFLVCIKGPHRGKDFRLIAGRNFIGRDASMDISLPDDKAVSREVHSVVSYDAWNNRFVLAPGRSRGITYCNGKQIETDITLKAYDEIRVGNSALLFLPLCGEQFTWSDDDKYE